MKEKLVAIWRCACGNWEPREDASAPLCDFCRKAMYPAFRLPSAPLTSSAWADL